MQTNYFFTETYRCRLCATLLESPHVEPSLEATQFELSEHSSEGLAHKERLCNACFSRGDAIMSTKSKGDIKAVSRFVMIGSTLRTVVNLDLVRSVTEDHGSIKINYKDGDADILESDDVEADLKSFLALAKSSTYTRCPNCLSDLGYILACTKCNWWEPEPKDNAPT